MGQHHAILGRIEGENMPEATFGIFNTASILVTVAAILGYLNHRFIGLPHTIGLTIMGAVASVIVAGVDAFTDILESVR
jgi:hypothetical protein